MLLISLLSFSGCAVSNAESREPAIDEKVSVELEPLSSDSRQPVLVELFTSEGCSSCPPADRQLTFLEKNQPVAQAEIITLSFHVDYWNQLGWKDEYSSAAYSNRQREYAPKFNSESVYTPQMVVDGDAEFVGSNAGKAANAIANAAKAQKGKVEASIEGNILKVAVSAMPRHGNAGVFLAIAEDGIVTDVRRGENAGSRLPHISVVRELKEIATLGSAANTKNIEFNVETLTSWKRENLKYIVFVQEDESRKVIAVGKAGK